MNAPLINSTLDSFEDAVADEDISLLMGRSTLDMSHLPRETREQLCQLLEETLPQIAQRLVRTSLAR